MAEGVWIVVTTVGDADQAGQLARAAVGEGLAACAQVETGMVSHYVWNGQQEQAGEVRIVFKTGSGAVERLTGWLRSRHPYEVPEILAWRAEYADPAYAKWVGGA